MKKGFLALGLLSLLLLLGCGDDNECPAIPDPAVKITYMAYYPDSVSVGGLVDLAVEATGNDLTYEWTATSGSFLDDEGDYATWKAPDEPTTARITAVVSSPDGTAARSVIVAVAMYIPEARPYYLSAATCAECHFDDPEYRQWLGSGHAKAWADLGSSAPLQFECYGCHTVGYNDADANGAYLNNGGYDETAVERLTNVQCESCHGPLGGPSDFSGIVDHDSQRLGSELMGMGTAENPTGCGVCHSGYHRDYAAEWRATGHARSH
ncbi:MAG: cytochrome c family protein, partial [Candidatus Eisenbacteria bacterium]|nr:cytochrome c family protein [Candidatus Eisenbacteria bacterium]